MLDAVKRSTIEPWQNGRLAAAESVEDVENPSTAIRKKPFLSPPPATPAPMKVWSEMDFYTLQIDTQRLVDNCYQIEKQESDYLNKVIEKAQVKQREDEEIARQKQNEAGKWGVAIMAFSWITSLVSIITGITLIATGVGVVAGVLMLAGGLIQIGSQIMEITGGWEKVRELLPGNDDEKKSAILSWIQIGITVFCMIMAAAGVVIGGFSLIGQNMQKATAMMSAIALLGKGVCDIGQGMAKSEHQRKLASLKRGEVAMTRKEERRKDILEHQEDLLPILTQIFTALSRVVELNHEFTRYVCQRR